MQITLTDVDGNERTFDHTDLVMTGFSPGDGPTEVRLKSDRFLVAMGSRALNEDMHRQMGLEVRYE